MRRLIRGFIGKTYKPLIERYYLSKSRNVKVLGVLLKTATNVFHPSLFYSSKFFGKFINEIDLENKKVLDVGCGSGILGLLAVRNGAEVTSVDINPDCIRITEYNSRINRLPLTVLISDLFENVTGTFDVVLINPPYYPKTPNSLKQHAWYCGTEFEYFDRLFGTLYLISNVKTKVYMVLSDGCDIERIVSMANEKGFEMKSTLEKQFVIEKNFIFSLFPKCEY